jgi:hypothetical protein
VFFYRLKEDGKILDKANFKYAEDCLQTDKNIVRGYDGGLYFEDEEPEKPQEIIDKENALKYEDLIISKIRERYTIDQELAILRQRDTKPQEFAEYDAYVEQCKLEVKQEINNGNENRNQIETV